MTVFLGKKNNAKSKIATVGGIDNSTNPVTFAVTTGEGTKFPASNFLVSIDDEILLCTSRTGDNLTCTRAQEGTTIASHSQNADVELRITAGTLEEFEKISNLHGMDYAADSQTNDTYEITLAPAPTAYFTGMVVKFKANTLNTGACTLNVNGLGAKTLKKNVSSDLETGDILAGQIVTVIYDGTNFQVLSKLSSTASSTDWIPAAETWTYVSVDDPIGIYKVNADVTTKYYPGYRIKLTNGGNVIKGIIQVVGTYGGTEAGYTYITFLHEIDPTDSLALYLMANSAITDNYYSNADTPYGFPKNPRKWTVYKKDTTARSKTNPVSGTIYYSDLGSINIAIPIGVWNIELSGNGASRVAANNYLSAYVALSTSSSSVSDTELLTRINEGPNNINYEVYQNNLFRITKTLALTSKTTYYVIGYVDWANHSVLSFINNGTPMFIKCVNAYL